jgi:hypothetical protein
MRTGKIARLPQPHRDQLNRRLADGQPANEILPWLNNLPDVRQILAQQFAGRPISPQNLSEWRAGGYQEWRAQQEIFEQLKTVTAEAEKLEPRNATRLSDQLGTLLALRYVTVIKASGEQGAFIPDLCRQLRFLRPLLHDIIQLRNADHRSARLELDSEKRDFDRQEPAKPSRAELLSKFVQWVSLPGVRNALAADPLYAAPTSEPVAVDVSPRQASNPQSSILNPPSSASPCTLAPTQSNVAPAKLAGTRVKVPPVELDCSRRNTTSTAPP